MKPGVDGGSGVRYGFEWRCVKNHRGDGRF